MDEETPDQLKERLIQLEESVEELLKGKTDEGFEGTLEVVQSDGGHRQTIVHFVDVEKYQLSKPPSKEIAHACFTKIIEDEWDPEERKMDRFISHGDLVVIEGEPCLYYCYVAKVDRTPDSPAGFQQESSLGGGIKNKNEKDQTRLELIIWSEVYPGGGANVDVKFSRTSLTPGSESESGITDLIITPDDPQPDSIDLSIPKLEITPSEEEPEPLETTFPTKLSFKEETPASSDTGECEFYTQKITTKNTPDEHFYIKTFKITPDTSTLSTLNWTAFNLTVKKTNTQGSQKQFLTTGVTLEQPANGPDKDIYGSKPWKYDGTWSAVNGLTSRVWDIEVRDSSSYLDCAYAKYKSNHIKITDGVESTTPDQIESNTLNITDLTPTSRVAKKSFTVNKLKLTDGTEPSQPDIIESNTLDIEDVTPSGTADINYQTNKIKLTDATEDPKIEVKSSDLTIADVTPSSNTPDVFKTNKIKLTDAPEDPKIEVESNTLDLTDINTVPSDTISMFDGSHRWIDSADTTDTMYYGAAKAEPVVPKGTHKLAKDLDISLTCEQVTPGDAGATLINVSEITDLDLSQSSPEPVDTFTYITNLATTVTAGSDTTKYNENTSLITAFSNVNGTEDDINNSTVLKKLDGCYIDPKSPNDGTPFDILTQVGTKSTIQENKFSGIVFEQSTSSCSNCLVLNPKSLKIAEKKQTFKSKTATPKLQEHDFYVKSTPVKITTYEREDILKIEQKKKKLKVLEKVNQYAVVANRETLKLDKVAINLKIDSTIHEVKEILIRQVFKADWNELEVKIEDQTFNFDGKKLVIVRRRGEFYGTKKDATFDFEKWKVEQTKRVDEVYKKTVKANVSFNKTITFLKKNFTIDEVKRVDEIYKKTVNAEVSYNKTHHISKIVWDVTQTKREDKIFKKTVNAAILDNYSLSFERKLWRFAQTKRTDKIYAKTVNLVTTDEKTIEITPWNLYIVCLSEDKLFWQDKESSFGATNLSKHTFTPGELTIKKQNKKVTLDKETFKWTHTNVKECTAAREKTTLKYEDAQNVQITPAEIEIKFENEKQVTLTPKQYKFIMEQKLKKLTPDEIELIYEEAKEYEVIPKNFTFELFKKTLKYKPVTVKTQDGELNVSAGECTTVNAQGGMGGETTENMGSVTITPKPPIPEFGISSTEFKEKEPADPPPDPPDPLKIHSLKFEDSDEPEPDPVDETIHSLELECDSDPDYAVEDLKFKTAEIEKFNLTLPEDPVIYSNNITTTDGILEDPEIDSVTYGVVKEDDQEKSKTAKTLDIKQGDPIEDVTLDIIQNSIGLNNTKEEDLPDSIDKETAKVCVTDTPANEIGDDDVDIKSLRYEKGTDDNSIPNKDIHSVDVGINTTPDSDNGDDDVDISSARYVKGTDDPKPVKTIYSPNITTTDTPNAQNGDADVDISSTRYVKGTDDPQQTKYLNGVDTTVADTPSSENGDDDVDISSTRYIKGTDDPKPVKYINSTAISFNTTPNYTVRNDKFETTLTDDPSTNYDAINTSRITIEDVTPFNRDKDCYYSRVQIRPNIDSKNDEENFDVHHGSKQSASDLPINFSSPLYHTFDISDLGDDNKTNKRYKYRIQETEQSQLTSEKATITTEKLELSDNSDEYITYDEPRVENSSLQGNAYIPLLNECPHNGTVEVLKTGPAFDSTSSGLFYDHEKGWKCTEAGDLRFLYKYYAEEWTLECGVWVKKGSLTEKTGVMEGPPLSQNPYFSYPIEVCIDGSVKTIHVLSTDIPPGQTGEDAVGHLIAIDCNQILVQ